MHNLGFKAGFELKDFRVQLNILANAEYKISNAMTSKHCLNYTKLDKLKL